MGEALSKGFSPERKAVRLDYEAQLRLQRAINGGISCILVLFLAIAAAYALFALSDNRRIYSQAENVQADMLQLKPESAGPGFQELQRVNPEVRAWISMEKTKIDFPVLQGENNLKYVNTDVYGNFLLTPTQNLIISAVAEIQ